MKQSSPSKVTRFSCVGINEQKLIPNLKKKKSTDHRRICVNVTKVRRNKKICVFVRRRKR